MATYNRTVPVKFGWCDPAGIMFFPRYFELANDTVEHWFGNPLGVSFKVLHETMRLSVPTARFEADFRAPSRLGDWIDIALSIERLGNSSATLRILMSCKGQERFDGRQVIVLTDGKTLKSKPWPDRLRAKMEKFVEAKAV